MQTVTTLANKAYWHLRGMLLSGELPPGAQISYKPIGKQIGASVTPVREAIGKLASEGLVDIVPTRFPCRPDSIRSFCLRCPPACRGIVRSYSPQAS